jgi:hypothetical protein
MTEYDPFHRYTYPKDATWPTPSWPGYRKYVLDPRLFDPGLFMVSVPEEAQETSEGSSEAVAGCPVCRVPPLPQPRDAVQFKLGSSPITVDVIRDRDAYESTIFVSNVQVARVGTDCEETVYRAVLETARRIGQIEF